MTDRYGLRLVGTSDGAAARSEPRLKVLTAGEKVFGAEWASALATRAETVTRCRTADAVVERIAGDRSQLGLVGVGPHTEAAFLESIAGAEEAVRRRTILVTRRLSADFVKAVVSAGAGDFVTTVTPVAELIVRLELRMLEAYGAAFRVPGVELTQREERLYGLLARRFGSAVSREEILRVAWQREAGRGHASNVVDVYVRYLRIKLERAAPHLEILTVRDVGYRMREREVAAKGSTGTLMPNLG